MSVISKSSSDLTPKLSNDDYYTLRPTTKLFDHQKSTIAWAKDKAGAILALSMGLGKTITSLALASHDNLGKVLIIGPKSLLNQWKREIVQHFTVADSEVFFYHGAARNKPLAQAGFTKAKFVLTTYQTARSDYSSIEYFVNELAKIVNQRKVNAILLATASTDEAKLEITKKNALLAESETRLLADLDLISRFKLILSIKFGHIIVDEAHNIRNEKTLMFRTMKYLKAHKRWALTGTPGINNRKDIIVLASFLGIAPYCERSWWIDASQEDVDGWRERYFYQVTKEEVLKLLPKSETTIDVKLGVNQQKAYNTLYKTSFPYVLTKILRLRQATVHNVIGANGRPENAKFDTIWDLISDDFKPISEPLSSVPGDSGDTGDLGGSDDSGDSGDSGGPSDPSDPSEVVPKTEPEIVPETETETETGLATATEIGVGTLIFSSFITALVELSKFLAEKKVKNYLFHGGMSQEARDDVVQSFISSKEPAVMLISIKAGAVGLNLTRASRVIILDPYWNLAIENQAIDRAHRIGQTKPVSVYRLCARGTIDKWVSDRQVIKTKDVDDFIAGIPPETPVAIPQTVDKITNNPVALGDNDLELGTKYF